MKNKIRIVKLFAIFMFLFHLSAFSQETPHFLKADNEIIQSKLESYDLAGWLFFERNANVLPGSLFTEMKTAFGLGIYDDMILSKSWDDKYGYFHNRYQHFYKGIKVEGSEFTEHYTKGKVEIAHGKIAEDLNINVIPTLNENAALNAALDLIGADIYAWQDTDWEAAIKLDANDETATYFPTGKLVITPLQWNNDYTSSNFVLAWTFTIKALSPANTTEIYINAHTGDVIRNQSIARNNGPAETLYYGTQTIDTQWRGFPHNNYRLKTNNNGRNIHTKSGTFADNFYLTSNETDNDDIWGTNQAGATTAHWVVSQSWDYFLDIHGRDGMDNQGSEVRVWANSTSIDMINNAVYIAEGSNNNNKYDYIEFGTSASTGDMAALDIGGHEYTHGVSHYTADFIYGWESGALDESFSDIFGFLIERYTNQNVVNNWTIGEDLPGGALRSLSNPSTSLPPQPETYLGINWQAADFTSCPIANNSNDNCGVHTNSGVQNRWFFTLSQGAGSVTGIGIDDAADIVYYNLTSFMQTNSQYADARVGSIAAARIIFGRCSNQEVQTTNAWRAVGVGASFTGPCVHITGIEEICLGDPYVFPITYHAVDVAGATFTWSIPTQWNITLSGTGNTTLTLNSFSSLPYLPYTFTLSVTSSLGGTSTMNIVVADCETQHGGRLQNPNSTLIEAEALKIEVLNEAALSIKVAPNPVRSQLNIQTTEVGEAYLYNSQGTLILQKSINQNTQLDLNDLPTGTYWLKIITNEESKVFPIIKL